MSSKGSPIATGAGDKRRRTTVHNYYANGEPDTVAIDRSQKSMGTGKRLKKTETRASKEKRKHSRKQAAEARKRRAEKANGRHTRPSKSPKEKGQLVINGFYEIETILDKRVNDKGIEEFLIRWKGCPESDNTWEPSDNLCDTAFVDAERLFEEEKAKRESKVKESEKLSGLNDGPVETMRSVKAENQNEAKIPETTKTLPPCEPIDPGDRELHWKWNDEEQVVFREVIRIDVNDSDASSQVTEAREDGKPVILVGHKGWSNFAIRWLFKNETKETKELSVDVTAKKEIPSKESSSSLLDLSKPHVLDISRMIEDIGQEHVPVIKLKYNEVKPISRTVKAKSFLEDYRDNFSLGGSTSETKGEGSESYLHQWQFPLASDMARKKLCYQSHPLPNGILRKDLLKHWLGDGDSPLQYLFMGVKGTMTKLHRDSGGLAILIAPIVGEKECVLVHRDDGNRNLYHSDARLDKIDLHSFPLMSFARVWKTILIPGEILLMPGGTYHQCRNLTPCLSYSRFHLDTVNIQAFLNSMYDGDAEELEHEKVIWNAVDDLVEQADAYVDKVQNHVLYPKKHEDTPLTTEMADIVKDVRCLRNVCRHIAIQKAVQEDVKGPVSSEKEIYTADDWSTMVMEIDMCLHEFQHRRQHKIPKHYPRPAVDTSIDTTMIKDGTRPLASTCGHELERAFCGLRNISAKDRGLALSEDVGLFENCCVTVHFEGKVINGTILHVEPQMEAAKLSYEGYPSVFDEYLPYDRLRDTGCGVQVRGEDVKPSLRVVSKGGSVGEDYRAIVKSITKETMYFVRLEVGKKVRINHWLTRSSIAKVHNSLVSNQSLMNQVKEGIETYDLDEKILRQGKNSGDMETIHVDASCTVTARVGEPETATKTPSIDLETVEKKEEHLDTAVSSTVNEDDSQKSHGPATTTGTPKDGRRKTIDELASTLIASKVMQVEGLEEAESLSPSRIIIGVQEASSSECSSDVDI